MAVSIKMTEWIVGSRSGINHVCRKPVVTELHSFVVNCSVSSRNYCLSTTHADTLIGASYVMCLTARYIFLLLNELEILP